MEFNPTHPIVKQCLQGMALEAAGEQEKAAGVFVEAYEAARSDFEKYITAYYVARHQDNVNDTLHWLQTCLRYALKVNDNSVTPALSELYNRIADCYEEIGDMVNAANNRTLAQAVEQEPTDRGPFYHGTKADLQVGDMLKAGFGSNYQEELTMNHIYFTAVASGAGLAAALAKGDGRERVYIVEPMGSFENDPNVTNKKFPGNPTRSYRTAAPLKIIGELEDWRRTTSKEVGQWKERLKNDNGEIIN